MSSTSKPHSDQTPSDAARTRTINPAKALAQHARTAQLMGVDFVPVVRSAERAGTPSQPDSATTSEAAIESPATHAAFGRPVAGEGVPPLPPRQEYADDPRRARSQRALDEIRARYEADAPHAHFVTAHTNIVFGEGDPGARLMFIGEAPGADEDRTGRPFVGRAGQLLNKMIVAMGLSRERVYIANVLKTRPPNNATPTIDEALRCAPYLYDQIAAIGPEVIVTLGLPATRLILGTDEAMSRLRGQWAEWKHPDQAKHPGVRVQVMPTFHPAFLLRSYTPENRAKVWSDLKQVVTRLGLK